MTISKEEAISIGTERFLENNKDLVLSAIERGAARAAMNMADSIGFSVSKKVEYWLAKNTPELIAAFKAKIAFDKVVDDLKAHRREEPAFDLPKKDGEKGA
jgi:hypothetical protein